MIPEQDWTQVEEVTLCCLHSEDCTYFSDVEREREVFINWDDMWLYVKIIIQGEEKASTMIPVMEIARVRITHCAIGEEVSDVSETLN